MKAVKAIENNKIKIKNIEIKIIKNILAIEKLSILALKLFFF